MGTSRAGIRGRRAGWAHEVRVTVTPRDLEILYLVGVCGVVRTREIARYFFGSRATANDRLRKLYVAGLLDCFVPDLADDNHYALTAAGRERVLAAHDVDAGVLKVVKKLPKKLDHALAVTEVRLSVAIACRESPDYALESFETDAELAAERHSTLLELIPDGIAKVRAARSGKVHALFVEIDLGTEAVTWLVRHKLAVYDRYAQLGTALYGVANPLVVLVVTSLRRARNIARALDAGRVRPRLVFALRADLTEANVLGAAYATGGDLLGSTGGDTATIFRQRLLP